MKRSEMIQKIAEAICSRGTRDCTCGEAPNCSVCFHGFFPLAEAALKACEDAGIVYPSTGGYTHLKCGKCNTSTMRSLDCPCGGGFRAVQWSPEDMSFKCDREEEMTSNIDISYLLDRMDALERDATGSVANLTKRELFAAMAMQGIISGTAYLGATIDEISKVSAEYADALIEELAKEKK